MPTGVSKEGILLSWQPQIERCPVSTQRSNERPPIRSLARRLPALAIAAAILTACAYEDDYYGYTGSYYGYAGDYAGPFGFYSYYDYYPYYSYYRFHRRPKHHGDHKHHDHDKDFGHGKDFHGHKRSDERRHPHVGGDVAGRGYYDYRSGRQVARPGDHDRRYGHYSAPSGRQTSRFEGVDIHRTHRGGRPEHHAPQIRTRDSGKGGVVHRAPSAVGKSNRHVGQRAADAGRGGAHRGASGSRGGGHGAGHGGGPGGRR
jgi:hypothetical protein